MYLDDILNEIINDYLRDYKSVTISDKNEPLGLTLEQDEINGLEIYVTGNVLTVEYASLDGDTEYSQDFTIDEYFAIES